MHMSLLLIGLMQVRGMKRRVGRKGIFELVEGRKRCFFLGGWVDYMYVLQTK